MHTSANGRRIQVVVGGQLTELGSIGELAAAFGRKSHTIRRWEASGLIPPAPLIIQPGEECTRRRWYPAPLIEAMRQLTFDEGLGRRRASGQFLRQQERLWSEWKSVITALEVEEPGVTDGAGQWFEANTLGQASPHR